MANQNFESVGYYPDTTIPTKLYIQRVEALPFTEARILAYDIGVPEECLVSKEKIIEFLSNMEDISSIKGPRSYKWMTYDGPMDHLLKHRNRKTSFLLKKGEKYGLRLSANKKDSRIIVATLGPTFVFTPNPTELKLLLKNSKRAKGRIPKMQKDNRAVMAKLECLMSTPEDKMELAIFGKKKKEQKQEPVKVEDLRKIIEKIRDTLDREINWSEKQHKSSRRKSAIRVQRNGTDTPLDLYMYGEDKSNEPINIQKVGKTVHSLLGKEFKKLKTPKTLYVLSNRRIRVEIFFNNREKTEMSVWVTTSASEGSHNYKTRKGSKEWASMVSSKDTEDKMELAIFGIKKKEKKQEPIEEKDLEKISIKIINALDHKINWREMKSKISGRHIIRLHRSDPEKLFDRYMYAKSENKEPINIKKVGKTIQRKIGRGFKKLKTPESLYVLSNRRIRVEIFFHNRDNNVIAVWVTTSYSEGSKKYKTLEKSKEEASLQL